MNVFKALQPFLFALLALGLYLLVYKSPIDPAAADFVTALITTLSCLGWSGIIIYTKEKKRTAVVLYTAIPLMYMLLLYLWCDGFNPAPHLTTIGLFLLAAVLMNLFTSNHMKYQEQKKKNSR